MVAVIWYDWRRCSSCRRSSEFGCPASMETGVSGNMPGAKTTADVVEVDTCVEALVEALVERRPPCVAWRDVSSSALEFSAWCADQRNLSVRAETSTQTQT